jgi:hypothetical protein
LLAERKRAEDAALLARFLSPEAETYFGALRQRELHAMGHVRRILLLVDIHGRDASLKRERRLRLLDGLRKSAIETLGRVCKSSM